MCVEFSVGRNGANRVDDVKTVQILLNTNFRGAVAWSLVLLVCSGCRSSERDEPQPSSSAVLSGGSAAIAGQQATVTIGGGSKPADATHSAVGSGGLSTTVGAAGATFDGFGRRDAGHSHKDQANERRWRADP
jgi:hypothetical protein